MNTVTINVGGKIFTTYSKTLESLPGTKLANLTKESSPHFDKDRNWFFFDRSSSIFENILDLYRHGHLHVPHDTCGGKLVEELRFWEIPQALLDDCCYDVIRKYNENAARMDYLKTKFDENVIHFAKDRLMKCRLTQLREMIWSTMEYPESSGIAKLYAVIYYLLVLLTCTTFVLNTHPTFRNERIFNPPHFTYVDMDNVTQTVQIVDYLKDTVKNPKELMYVITETKPFIYCLDIACYLIFSVELAVRFLVTPSKKMLLKSVMIYFDIILVISNSIAFGLDMNPKVMEENEQLLRFYIVCKIVVILRLCRLLKLTRHLGGLKVLSLSFRSSLKDLCQLVLPFIITILLISGIMYYAEFGDHQTFQNIPITIWWCVVTMTTVGYGDVTPATYVGYIIASFCAIFGLVLVALPIAIIASNFDGLRNINTIREEKIKRVTEKSVATNLSDCKILNVKSNKVWCTDIKN